MLAAGWPAPACFPIEAGALPGVDKRTTTTGGWQLLRNAAAGDGDGRWLYGARGRATLWRLCECHIHQNCDFKLNRRSVWTPTEKSGPAGRFVGLPKALGLPPCAADATRVPSRSAQLRISATALETQATQQARPRTTGDRQPASAMSTGHRPAHASPNPPPLQAISRGTAQCQVPAGWLAQFTS